MWTVRLQQILTERPDFYRPFRLLADRLREVLTYLSVSRTLEHDDYLRKRLLMIAEFWRRDGHEDPVIELSLSQADAADLLGLCRQTVNRQLARLEEQGVLERGFHTVRIFADALAGNAPLIKPLPKQRCGP